jgi:hypothetical protein
VEILVDLVEQMGKKWVAIQHKINRAASSCRDKYRERAKATRRESVKARERASALEVIAKMTDEDGHHNNNTPDNTPMADELRGAFHMIVKPSSRKSRKE